MARLSGKVAMITGAGTGIGKAAAKLFAAEGAKVAVAEWKADLGAATVAEIEADGGQAMFIETDVGDADQMQAALDAAVGTYGGLDVMYNNAGGATAKDGKVTEIELEEFWRTITVDLYGTFLGCRFAIPLLAERGGGSIINTTSIRAMKGTQGADAYTSAKGGVLTLTRALAQEVGHQNIRVNAIAPGLVATERVKAIHHGDVNKNPLAAEIPLGYGLPDQVAGAALFLASEDSRWVTGAILPVDGGSAAI